MNAQEEKWYEPLRRFPRPPEDNGFGLALSPSPWGAGQDEPYLKQLRAVGATWTVLPALQEPRRVLELCAKVWAAGVMPILEFNYPIDDSPPPWEHYVTLLQGISIPALLLPYGDPGSAGAWRSAPPAAERGKIYAQYWSRAAERIARSGGWTGFNIESAEDWAGFLRTLGGGSPLFARSWWAVRTRPLNRPPAYPFIPNALGIGELPRSLEVDEDCALSFLTFSRWNRAGLRSSAVPMLGIDNGWYYGAEKDRAYKIVKQEEHAAWHLQMFEWFRTRKLPSGDELPDELLCLMSRGAENYGTSSWFGSLGHPGTVAAFQERPPFRRYFSWEAPPTRTFEVALAEAATALRGVTLDPEHPLTKFGLQNGQGLPVTSLRQFRYGENRYWMQVFTRGVVSCRIAEEGLTDFLASRLEQGA